MTFSVNTKNYSFTQVDAQDNTQVTTQVTTQDNDTLSDVQKRIIDSCRSPKSVRELADILGFKERKSVLRYLRPLTEQGRIAMTVPDKPNSRNQKYVTIN